MLGYSNIFEDVDCVYDDRKMKPGLRTGVVEKLNQRVGMYNPAPLLLCIANFYFLHPYTLVASYWKVGMKLVPYNLILRDNRIHRGHTAIFIHGRLWMNFFR